MSRCEPAGPPLGPLRERELRAGAAGAAAGARELAGADPGAAAVDLDPGAAAADVDRPVLRARRGLSGADA
jgi:hypothetical protein